MAAAAAERNSSSVNCNKGHFFQGHLTQGGFESMCIPINADVVSDVGDTLYNCRLSVIPKLVLELLLDGCWKSIVRPGFCCWKNAKSEGEWYQRLWNGMEKKFGGGKWHERSLTRVQKKADWVTMNDCRLHVYWQSFNDKTVTVAKEGNQFLSRIYFVDSKWNRFFALGSKNGM